MKHLFFLGLLIFTAFSFANAQAGRKPGATGDSGGVTLPLIITREKETNEPVTSEFLGLYENGLEQKIKSLQFDGTPARIVVLVDNSQTLRTDVEKMKSAAKEFLYEIFDGDLLFYAAYDEKAEIIHEWTDDAKKVETSLAAFRKKGNPYLFDALGDVLEQIVRPLLPGARKTAVVIISDGLDRGSKKSYDSILAEYQKANVAVYALQIPDRTGGAYKRDAPKPEKVIADFTAGTGGKAFDFAEPQIAAKAICDELRKNRYLLTYSSSSGAATLDARRLLVVANEGINVRFKSFEPATLK